MPLKKADLEYYQQILQPYIGKDIVFKILENGEEKYTFNGTIRSIEKGAVSKEAPIKNYKVAGTITPNLLTIVLEGGERIILVTNTMIVSHIIEGLCIQYNDSIRYVFVEKQ